MTISREGIWLVSEALTSLCVVDYSRKSRTKLTGPRSSAVSLFISESFLRKVSGLLSLLPPVNPSEMIKDYRNFLFLSGVP